MTTPEALPLATQNGFVLIALQHSSGTISRMQFGTYRPFKQLDRLGAAKAGFQLNADGDWVRDPADANIEKEIAKTAWATPLSNGGGLTMATRCRRATIAAPAPGSLAARLAEIERKLAAAG